MLFLVHKVGLVVRIDRLARRLRTHKRLGGSRSTYEEDDITTYTNEAVQEMDRFRGAKASLIGTRWNRSTIETVEKTRECM